MRRISSKMTFFYKRIFPAAWFGFLILIFLLIAVPLFFGGKQTEPPPYPMLVVPLAMMGFGYFFMKKLVSDLVDEVWEDGDSLVVKNRGQEEHIAFGNIKNISYSQFMNPPRVTVVTRTPTTFGDKIAFFTPARFFPLSSSPLIDDLIDRVDQARQRRG
jgi:tellurite resistance protein TehA-like permease